MRIVSLLAGLALAMLAFAQEGHPLTGTWHGEWTSGSQKNPIVMFLKWDTKNIVGTVNPGPNAMPLKAATLDPTNWMVHFEAEGKEKVVADGKIENLGSYNRTITGTWTQGTAKGNFKITRD
jgi:hypothetical protein